MTTAPLSIAHSAFMAYVTDDASHAVLRSFAEEAGLPSSVVQPGDLHTVTEVISQTSRLPKVILVDIDGIGEPLPELVRLIEALEGVSKIIAIGTKNDVKLFRSLLNAGASDYVVKPLAVDLLLAAYENAGRSLKVDDEQPQASRIIPVIGARGGIGTTTLAVNLGWMLAHRMDQPTALFDLDLQYGTSTLSLDLTPGHGLREALETPGRLDSLLIASSMASESDRFSILGAEEPLEDSIRFESAAVSAITGELKNNFSYILVDLPRHFVAQHKALLAESESIIIVAEQTLAAVRDVVRLKAALKVIAPNARQIVVVARVAAGKGAERSAQLDQTHFEKGIQDKVAAIIPEDPQPVAYAANRGQALGRVAPAAPVSMAIAGLAESLTGQKLQMTNQDVWSRLTQKFRKAKKS